MIIDSKTKKEINTIQEWFDLCPPDEGIDRWEEKRSAKEMAKFWIDAKKRSDFCSFLSKNGFNCSSYTAYPKFETKFDEYYYGRVNDLVIIPDNNDFVCSIDGKDDESFGKTTLRNEMRKAFKTRRLSYELDRIINLYATYFFYNQEAFNLKYPLVYWLAGTVAEAERCNSKKALMIVQEFYSHDSNARKIQDNNISISSLLKIISEGKISNLNDDEISPVINTKYTHGIDLYIGKYMVKS